MAQIDPRAPRSSPLLPHSRSAPCTSLIAAIAVLAAAAGLWLAGQDGLTAQGPPSADQDLGQAVHVGDVIIRRYDPTPALITRVTLVDRPRFPVTDIHAHWTRAMEPAALLDAMDDVGVERAVNLSGGSGDELDEMLERFHQVAPGRLAIFANIDFDRIDEPGFGRAMAAMLERAHARGAAGLKIFKSLGLTIRDGSGRLVPIDDARLDPIWAMCGTLGVPVLIHSADPVAFFAPVDGKNERWLQLQRFPGWSVHGPPFPAREDVLRQRDRVLERHPNTRFIGAHMGGNSEDLEALAHRLDRYPNFVVDLSGRVAELGRQPYTSRRFLLQYQDRVLFGTDRYPGRPDQPRTRIYYRFLETDDEYFKYYDHPFPPSGEWRIYGVHLPDEVLRKVYQANADRALGWTVRDRAQ
jgi:uncharacterized protein